MLMCGRRCDTGEIHHASVQSSGATGPLDLTADNLRPVSEAVSLTFFVRMELSHRGS